MEPKQLFIVKFVNGRMEIASRLYDYSEKDKAFADFREYKKTEKTANLCETIHG